MKMILRITNKLVKPPFVKSKTRTKARLNYARSLINKEFTLALEESYFRNAVHKSTVRAKVIIVFF